MYLWYQPSVFIIVRSCRILERRETIYGWNIRDCMGCAFWLQVLSCFTGRVGERKTGLFRSRAIRVSFSSDTFSKSLCGSERLVYYHKVAICSLRNARSFSIRFCFHCRSSFTSERLTFFFCSDWFSSCSFFFIRLGCWDKSSFKWCSCDERSSIVFPCNLNWLSCWTDLPFNCWISPELVIFNCMNSASKEPTVSLRAVVGWSLLSVTDRGSATDVGGSERVKFEGSVAVEIVAMPEIEWLETRISASETNCIWCRKNFGNSVVIN